jgi:hypothetical protein
MDDYAWTGFSEGPPNCRRVANVSGPVPDISHDARGKEHARWMLRFEGKAVNFCA